MEVWHDYANIYISINNFVESKILYSKFSQLEKQDIRKSMEVWHDYRENMQTFSINNFFESIIKILYSKFLQLEKQGIRTGYHRKIVRIKSMEVWHDYMENTRAFSINNFVESFHNSKNRVEDCREKNVWLNLWKRGRSRDEELDRVSDIRQRSIKIGCSS